MPSCSGWSIGSDDGDSKYVSPKHSLLPTSPHDVTILKTNKDILQPSEPQESNRLKVFESRVEKTVSDRRMYKFSQRGAEIFYSAQSILRMIKQRTKWVVHVACMIKFENTYVYRVISRIIVSRGVEKNNDCIRTDSFFGSPKGKHPLGRSRQKWRNNIRVEFKEIPWRV